jgi:hypothetical protein
VHRLLSGEDGGKKCSYGDNDEAVAAGAAALIQLMNFKTAASALVDVGAAYDAEPEEVDCPVPGDDIRRAAAAQRNFRALPWFENLVPPRGTRGDGDLDRQEEGPRAGWITSLPCSRTTSKCRLNAKSKDI